ncbi:MAG: hypothetical protein E2577_16675, partial [Starkeya sp.]|nr:hypothetical protein [Starkeya sp.]
MSTGRPGRKAIIPSRAARWRCGWCPPAIAGLYDRAALIALPPELRQRYRDTVYARLPAG